MLYLFISFYPCGQLMNLFLAFESMNLFMHSFYFYILKHYTAVDY